MATAETKKIGQTMSLRISVLRFVCGLIVIAATVCSLVSLAFTVSNARSDTAHLADSMSAVIAGWMKQTDDPTFASISYMLKEDPEAFADANSIVITDASGFGVIRETKSAEKSQMLMILAEEASRAGVPLAGFRDGSYSKAQPVMRDGVHVGVVAVSIPMASSGFDLAETLLWSLGSGLLVCLLAIPLAVLLINRLTAPLKQLTDFATAVSGNKLSARLEIHAGNEFDTLANAFNAMMDRMETAMQHIQRLAFTDQTTGLQNRESFIRQVRRALQSREDKSYVAIVLFNVDRFRWVNETLGPENGDEVLGLIGNRIESALNNADRTVRIIEAESKPSVIARLGGDEFAVLVPTVEAKSDITRLMQMVIAAMRQPIEISGQTVTLGLSGGVALAPIHGDKAEDLVKNADLALKESRRSGRGKARFYSTKLNQIAMDRLNLEADLRKAIELNEFVPFYQPKVCFKTGKIAGSEALVRWKRDDGDLISPGIFIPMAEQLGLISSVGNAVLDQACHEAARWMRSGHDCKVAVNVSPLQFEEADFADKVIQALRDADLPPGRLELEITETMAVGDTDRVTEIMRPLRAMGVRLAIDDFGAGHSNLVTLTRLPFDVFKIDQQFISALHSDKQAPAIVEMILAMAQTMGLESVAEGVETPSQSDFLRRRNCTLAQGYLYSKPIPADDFAKLLDNWQPFGKLADDDVMQAKR